MRKSYGVCHQLRYDGNDARRIDLKSFSYPSNSSIGRETDDLVREEPTSTRSLFETGIAQQARM